MITYWKVLILSDFSEPKSLMQSLIFKPYSYFHIYNIFFSLNLLFNTQSTPWTKTAAPKSDSGNKKTNDSKNKPNEWYVYPHSGIRTRKSPQN